MTPSDEMTAAINDLKNGTTRRELEAYERGRLEENEACAKVVLHSEMFCKDEQRLKTQLVAAIRARVK